MLNQDLMRNLEETFEESVGEAYEESLRQANLENAAIIKERISHLQECYDDLAKHSGVPLSQVAH